MESITSFNRFFDIIIIALLAYAIVMFLTGNEERISKLFGSNQGDTYKTYDKDKFNKATFLFCVVLLVNEVVMLLLRDSWHPIFYINLVVAVITIAVYLIYLRKIKKK